jgi:hypothetical protein
MRPATAFLVCILMLCGCDEENCACETTSCTCNGVPPPEIIPSATPEWKKPDLCDNGRTKLSFENDFVRRCHGGSGDLLEYCRCAAWPEQEAAWAFEAERREIEGSAGPSPVGCPEGLPCPDAKAKRRAPKRTSPVLEDPFENSSGSEVVDKVLADPSWTKPPEQTDPEPYEDL